MSSEDMEKMRILVSEKRSRSFRIWLRGLDRERWAAHHEACPNCNAVLPWSEAVHASWQEVREFVASSCVPDLENPIEDAKNPEPPFLQLFDMIEANEAEGKLPYEAPGLSKQLWYQMSRKWWMMDFLSALGFAIPPGYEEEAEPFRYAAPGYLLEPFEPDGGIIQILGGMRRGKTSDACLIAEIDHKETNAPAYSNVVMDKWPSWVHPTPAMSDVLRGFANALRKDEPLIWILDDATVSGYGRPDGASRPVKGFDKFIRIVPKWKGHLYYIEQREKSVTTTIADLSEYTITAENRGFFVANLGRWKAFKAVPKPKEIVPRSGAYASLVSDVDLSRFLANLSYESGEPKGGAHQADRIDAFLDKALKELEAASRPKEDPSWHRTVDEAPEGLTIAELAVLAGVSESSIVKYRAEKKATAEA